jgi:hypothetical protein
MSRRPCTFRESDVTRALKGARKAGYSVDRAVINRAGDIELRFGTADHDNNQDSNPLDTWMATHADQAQGH